MTQPEALKALIAKVEAGGYDNSEQNYELIEKACCFSEHHQTASVIFAWRDGDINAAVAVKDAMVPQLVWANDESGHCALLGKGMKIIASAVVADKPATALVLASLKAKLHEVEG